MIITLMKGLCSMKNIIVENGIKYALYLFCFYLFDAICWIIFGSNKTCYKNRNRRNRRKRINRNRRNQRMGNNNSNGKPLIEPQNAEEDSVSIRNQSSNGSNETIVNKPMNCNIVSCISHTALRNPMIEKSTEEHSFNKRQFPINTSQHTEPFANKRRNAIQNKFSKSCTQRQRRNFFVNRGNARIFNQKFTSFDNIHSSFPRSSASYKYRKLNRTNFFYNGEDSKFFNNSRTNFAPTNEKKNFIFDGERNKKEIQGEERNFRRYGPNTEYKSYYSRMHVGNNKSKQNYLYKYKEIDTQTDSAFLTDDAVEMVSVGTMWPEQEIYGNSTHKSQGTDMNQQVNYIPDYGLMDEKLFSIAYQLLSYNKILSLLTNLNSSEQTCAVPDINIAGNQGSTKFVNSINTSEPTRASPDFPEVQHPSPEASINVPEHFILSSIKDEYVPKFRIKPMTVTTSPALSSMRRLS